MEEITTRTLDLQGMSPSRAYAALRAKAPDRTSFLLEMTEPDEGGEQRSIIGFLAKRESAYPAAVDALGAVAAVAAEMPPISERPEIAAACLHDVLSVILFDAVLTAHGLAPWPDLSFVGREIREATSIAFDHVAGTITIAATNPNVVERVARVLAAAPELPDLPPPAEAKRDSFFEQPPEAAFTKQLGKAGRRLSLGSLTELSFGRRFSAPPRGADMFDVLRALRDLSPGRHAFFIEYAKSPMFPAYAVAGVARSSMRLHASSGAAALSKALVDAFPIEQLCGAPAKDALSAWRDIASTGVAVRGSAIARTRPGGAVEVLRPHVMVTLEEDQLHTHGVAKVIEGRDPRSHTTAAAENVLAELAAICRAHAAAEARQASTTAD